MSLFLIFLLLIESNIVWYIFGLNIGDQTVFQSIFFNLLNFLLLLNFNHLKLLFNIMNVEALIIWLILNWIISTGVLLVRVFTIRKAIRWWVFIFFVLFLILFIILTWAYWRIIFKFNRSYTFLRCHKLLGLFTLTWNFNRHLFLHETDLLLWYYCRNIFHSFNFIFLKVNIFIYAYIFT